FVEGSGEKRLGFEVAMPISPQAPADSGATTMTGGAANAAALLPPLWKMLLYAFIGGLILNVMPCVLPVISLKILGFVRDAQSSPARVRRLGLMYGFGVLFSFLILAGIVIGFKAAGHRAGWGMQFSNPHFLVGLTVLVTLVALNLFGLFEVQPGARILDAAGAASSRHGDSGAFFNGMLATVLATPCTAPYLGAALGFAFLQPPAVTLLVFVMVAIGLALPYVVLSWQPAWLKFLPRPGPWMERFKIAMGFPMLATAIWLCSLTATFYGNRAWWLGLFLVILALAAWIYGEFVQRGKSRRPLAVLAVLLLLIGGYAWAIEGQLRWTEPLADSAATDSLRKNPDGIDWQRWDPRAVAHAQEEGHPVLVDFTADWCLTCQANKRIAMDIPSVRAKLKEIGAASFIGDYTRLPEEMTAELNRYGRAGVPLVLVFPPKSGEPPIVLPELLTPGIVLDALNRAVK
ncbi:MAG TPA: thioredoxin family protein, partial [Verrucomicrobiae bacterium]|nr:thioredoxin family protein [Verrucomicrobiae bacterium]